MSEPLKKILKNPDFIYDFNFFMYNISGFGILENSGKWKKIFYSIYYNIMHFIYNLLMVLYVTDLYLVMDDKEKLNLNLCVTIVGFGSMIKIWTLIKKLNVVVDIRKKFHENFNLPFVGGEAAHEEILGKCSRHQLLITTTLSIFAIPFLAIWILFPLLDPNSKERKFCLPLPIFKETSTPTYEIVYTTQASLVVHFVWNIMHNDLLMIGFLVRICGHFDVLIYNISKIKDVYPKLEFEKFVPEHRGMGTDDDEDPSQRSYVERKNKIKSVVEVDKNLDFLEKLKNGKTWRKKETLKLMRQNVVHHTCILQQLEDIIYAYDGQLFTQMTVGALVIAVVAFDVILQSRKFNASVIQQLLYVGAVLTDIFLLCYYGTQIKEKSERVVEALYDAPWYDMDVSNRKICSIMIAKARNYPHLKARYLFSLDMETYQSLVKFSYNLMALLNESK